MSNENGRPWHVEGQRRKAARRRALRLERDLPQRPHRIQAGQSTSHRDAEQGEMIVELPWGSCSILDQAA
jgi:hypothetical protein